MIDAAVRPVLVAHGQGQTRRRYLKIFARDPHPVIDVRNGRDALVRALIEPPALVVTELRLPFLDGYALCQVLRRDPATAGVPILAIDSIVSGRERDRATEAGADAFLEASATAAQIRAAATALISASHGLRQRAERVRARADAEVARSANLIARAERQRIAYEQAHAPLRPGVSLEPAPCLACPGCDQPLAYTCTHVSGASARHAEQWDEYLCPACGPFEYRRRTRTLRPTS